MQTFLPCTDFVKSAKCLDYKRLGKQRVEAKQILNILTGITPESKWKHHPCVKQWKSYEQTLKIYHDIMIQEWVNRGYNNTMQTYGKLYPKESQSFYWQFEAYIPPIWLTDEFSSYHRSTLLYKDPEWYGQFGWTEEPKYEYLWPTKETK